MPKRFRVALSFPGEKREFIRQVASELAGVLERRRVLYDEYLIAELARPNLDVYLGQLYHDESELIVPFFCADYERKEWCGLELRQIRDLLKQRKDEHIMPFRFDDALIAGALSIDGYIKVADRSAQQVAALILERLAVVVTHEGTPAKTTETVTTDPTPPAYFLFASQGATTPDPNYAFYRISGERGATALTKLFVKQYGAGPKAPKFFFAAVDSIPDEDQILAMEALDVLEVYRDPDRLIYDPPPSVETHQLAQYAERAEAWEALLKKRGEAKSHSTPAPDSKPINGKSDEQSLTMDPYQRLNAGLNLFFLLAQTYYKLLENAVGNPCCALDLDLNQSYFWTTTNITNLLNNNEDLRDFPGKFQPSFPDLNPSTVRDVEWEDMIAPDAENFLSSVQQYVLSKGIHEPEEGSQAAIFVALYRPSVDLSLSRGEAYRKRMRDHWKKVMAKGEPNETPSPQHEDHPNEPAL